MAQLGVPTPWHFLLRYYGNPYYDSLKEITTLHLFHEGAVSPAFAALLRYCARQFRWTLVEKGCDRSIPKAYAACCAC